MGERNETGFGYAEFGSWYDSYRTEVLEPALDHAMDALQRELDDGLTDRDIARIRSLSGRVKSKRRTWRKVMQPRYRQRMTTVDDIPAVIDDLVGMRLTCTNLRDIEMVQVALESLPRQSGKRRSLGLDPDSERDYVENPKESGYRGWHVNLDVQHDGAPITCELQVRTLLQDSWGELTHEDTYSKAGESPPLVEVLSTRMADLLATLDDIAEDLRNELDRIDEAIVAETAGQAEDPGDDALDLGPGADAADILLERWNSLDRPLELSSIAWALQHEFGAEVSDDWFGFRTFKRFLRAAIPDGEISTGRRAYLLPPGSAPSDADDTAGISIDIADIAEADIAEADIAEADIAEAERTDARTDVNQDESAEPGQAPEVPDEVLELRRVDRGFPLVATADWLRIYEHLAESWRRAGSGTPSTKMVNQLTRSARDRARSAGEPLSRRHLDYVAKAVLAATESGDPLDAAKIGDVFTGSVLERLAELRIVPTGNAPARARIGRWLLG